jgi:hypothetical protein
LMTCSSERIGLLYSRRASNSSSVQLAVYIVWQCRVFTNC